MPLSDKEIHPPPPEPSRKTVLEFLRQRRRHSEPWFAVEEIQDGLLSSGAAWGRLAGTVAEAILRPVLDNNPATPSPRISRELAERERIRDHLKVLESEGFVEAKPDDKGKMHFKATDKWGQPREV